MSDPEIKVLLIDETQESTFVDVKKLLEKGWILRPGTYPTFGTESMRLVQLVRPEDIEEVRSKHEGIIQSVMVPWPKASTLEDLEEAQKHLMNELLENRGWIMLEHYSKEALLVLKEAPEAPTPPEPVAEIEAEEPEVEVEAGEPVESLAYRKASSGEVVLEVDASPEAVREAEEALAAEMPEKPKFDREFLGCDSCVKDDACTPHLRQVHYDVALERKAYQCFSHEQKKEAPK